jgi:hypothetical protein
MKTAITIASRLNVNAIRYDYMTFYAISRASSASGSLGLSEHAASPAAIVGLILSLSST